VPVVLADLTMPTPSRTYQSLLHEIAELYTAARASVVRMYWEIGQLPNSY